MKKKLLLLLAVLSTALAASAYDFESNGIYYQILSDEDMTCEVAPSTSYDNSGAIVIPSTVSFNEKNYSVVAIGESAFRDCSRLTSVVIPNSVTTIGDEAFRWCSDLTSVEIPNSVTKLGEKVFFNCI